MQRRFQPKIGIAKWGMIASLFACSVGLFSCSRLPNVQGNGEDFLQGLWKQDSLAHADKLMSYTRHEVKFTCDSFYLDMTTFSKVNYYEEACFNKGVWKEFAKGVYAVKNDTLVLHGHFTKANYKQKISGCYRSGQYKDYFKIIHKEKEKLILERLSDHNEYSLSLITPIQCEPKPL